jgi:hypothetical protein
VSRLRCPETANGEHGRTDVQGRCLFCHLKIDSALEFSPDHTRRRQLARAQDPLSVDGPDESDYLDGRDGV